MYKESEQYGWVLKQSWTPFWHNRAFEEKTRERGRKLFAFLRDIPEYLSGSLVDTMTIIWNVFQFNSTIGKLSSFQDT